MCKYPGGVVPVALAARILGVSRQRVMQLIDVHRMPVIDDMPGATAVDIFVPIDALLGAPMPNENGPPRSIDVANGSVTVRQPRTNPWADWMGYPQSLENFGLEAEKSYMPRTPSAKHCRTET